MSPRASKRLAIAIIVVCVLALIDLLLTTLALVVSQGSPAFWLGPLSTGTIYLGFTLFQPNVDSGDAILKVVVGSLAIALAIPFLLLLVAFRIYARRRVVS